MKRNRLFAALLLTATLGQGQDAFCTDEPDGNPFEGYLFAYFEGQGEQQEHLRFALSNDGVNWRALNGNRPVVSSDSISESGGIRDPHILRGEDGLDTMLAERASNLSGGQRQRLAIARALLHATPVYVFDEATSNVDAESEDAIMGAVRGLAGRATVILISHRLANVVGADKIFVLDGGRVVEHGRHDDLVAAGGRYATLWRAQRELEEYGAAKGMVA